MIEAPQGYIVSTECQKATWQNGYRRKLEQQDGWARWGSTTAKGSVYLAAGGPQGPWYLAIDHEGVAAELGLPNSDLLGPALVRYSFATLSELYAALSRVYALAVSLPDGPLEDFRARTGTMPCSTEAERLIVQRVGQNIFRDALMEYWSGACAVLGVTEPRLLRASHIKPWAECETDVERLDVYNGLLLAAHLDAAFDAFLISFADDGRIILSDVLTEPDRNTLGLRSDLRLSKFAPAHLPRLAWHRQRLVSSTTHPEQT